MRNIHLTQVGVFKPLLKGLNHAGVPVQKLLDQTELSRFSLDNLEAYIPVSLEYRLFDIIARQEGLIDPIYEFNQYYRINKIGEWGKAILACPDLLTANRNAEKYSHVIETHCDIWLEIRGPLSVHHIRYNYPRISSINHSEEIALLLTLEVFRMYAGKDWSPLEIHVPWKDLGSIEKLISIEGVTVKFEQPDVALVFPTSLLSRKLQKCKVDCYFGEMALPRESLSDRIEYLVDEDTSSMLTHFNVFCRLSDLSARSLQRQLQNEDTSFQQIVDNWRFKKAVSLLDDRNVQINELAERLNYTNTVNFIRAFKRWTGMTPTRFRDKE